MSSATIEYQKPNNFGKFLFIIFCVVLVAFAVTYGTHAIQRHGTAAVVVRKCMENQGPLETWHNTSTGRDAHIVCVDKETFGLQICDKNDCEITSFLKEKMKRIEQIYRYLENRGYSPK